MLVIVAGEGDEHAKSLSRLWVSRSATVLTSADLSRPGWQHYVGAGSPRTGRAVVGGRVIEQSEIEGVLSRWPCVFPQELLHVIPEDRDYVAAEMTAFLVSWLSNTPFPVLNQPTPSSLIGPAWGAQQWLAVAESLRIPIRPFHHRVSLVDDDERRRSDPTEEGSVQVTVVGKHTFGSEDETVVARARRLAEAANVGLANFRFSSPDDGSVFLAVDLLPSLDAHAAAAVLEWFDGE